MNEKENGKMKLTVGLGSIDDYIPFVEAGADECFCGYVPEKWMLQGGLYAPLNRREVLYYNVQIGSKSELEILREMIAVYHVPVSITLNALYYREEQYPMILELIKECCAMGFDSFIIADIGLLFYLHHQKVTEKIRLTMSGEFGELNEYVIDWLQQFGIKRIIFHRNMSVSAMKECIQQQNLEWEAFVLNEKCHFHGAFCNSLHCDELTHICYLPYRRSGREQMQISQEIEEMDFDVVGASGCGLCALWKLREAGITHLKLVGRGNYSDDMERDIRAVAQARKILEQAENEADYISRMKKAIFPTKCSGMCYYK